MLPRDTHEVVTGAGCAIRVDHQHRDRVERHRLVMALDQRVMVPGLEVLLTGWTDRDVPHPDLNICRMKTVLDQERHCAELVDLLLDSRVTMQRPTKVRSEWNLHPSAVPSDRPRAGAPAGVPWPDPTRA